MASANVEFKETSLMKFLCQQQHPQLFAKKQKTKNPKDTHGVCAIWLHALALAKFLHLNCILRHSTVMQCYEHFFVCYEKTLCLTSAFCSLILHHQWRQTGAQWGDCYTRVEFLLLTLTQHYDVKGDAEQLSPQAVLATHAASACKSYGCVIYGLMAANVELLKKYIAVY